MSTLIVPCPHCNQRAQLDSNRLPDQPAYFPCPHCKQKVVVDKRKLLQDQQAQPATPPTAQPPAAQDRIAAVPLPASTQADRRFTRIPTDSRLPSGIIVGDDSASIELIRSRLATVGSDVEVTDSIESARSVVMNESPELCIVVASGEVRPPYAPMRALCELPASFRRGLYLVLAADGVKTLDGTAAFMFEVNMVLGKQDLENAESALYTGFDYHRRLYRPYHQAEEQRLAL